MLDRIGSILLILMNGIFIESFNRSLERITDRKVEGNKRVRLQVDRRQKYNRIQHYNTITLQHYNTITLYNTIITTAFIKPQELFDEKMN